MEQFISENKAERFTEVLDHRTRYLTVVLENIYQAQNASAVIRTAECLGVQDVHIIDQFNNYNLNPDVVVGSSKWVDVKKYRRKEQDNTANCFSELKSRGYKVIATSPHEDDFFPETLPLDQPVAIVFGNEKEGISDYTKKNADGFLRIPMHGFTESYNISVSAAISLYTLTQRIRSEIKEWKLSDEEKDVIRYKWMKKVIKRFDLLETEFYTNHRGKK